MELIAFLVMSTLLTASLIYNVYVSIFPFYDINNFIYIFGILTITISALGNIINFMTAYFAYQHFDEIFMFKLGAKLVYHEMFKWTQFLRATIKTDLCLSLFVYIAFLCFDHNSVFVITSSSICILFNIMFIFLMKKYLKEEMKCVIYVLISIRICIFGLMISSFSVLIQESTDSFITEYNGILYISICMFIVLLALIFEFISCIKCTNNFGKGLQMMIERQMTFGLTKFDSTSNSDI